MSTARKYQPSYTMDDYRHWKGSWELWYGTAVSLAPSPFGPHQKAVLKFANQIENSISQQQGASTVYAGLDWIVQNDTVVRPDVMLVCGEQPEQHLERPPTLTVEVLSPSTAYKDRTAKRDLYESQGVEHYLLVDVDERSICWLALQADGRYEDVSAQIPADGLFDVKLNNGCVLHFNRQAAFGSP